MSYTNVDEHSWTCPELHCPIVEFEYDGPVDLPSIVERVIGLVQGMEAQRPGGRIEDLRASIELAVAEANATGSAYVEGCLAEESDGRVTSLRINKYPGDLWSISLARSVISRDR